MNTPVQFNWKPYDTQYAKVRKEGFKLCQLMAELPDIRLEEASRRYDLSIPTISQMQIVGRDTHLNQLFGNAKTASKLPAGWDALYRLAKLSVDDREELIADTDSRLTRKKIEDRKKIIDLKKVEDYSEKTAYEKLNDGETPSFMSDDDAATVRGKLSPEATLEHIRKTREEREPDKVNTTKATLFTRADAAIFLGIPGCLNPTQDALDALYAYYVDKLDKPKLKLSMEVLKCLT